MQVGYLEGKNGRGVGDGVETYIQEGCTVDHLPTGRQSAAHKGGMQCTGLSGPVCRVALAFVSNHSRAS